MNNFIGSVFFAQSGPRYNYLLDCLHLCCSFPIFIIANEIAKYFIKKNNFTMMFADRMFIKIKWEWAVFLFKTILIYIVPVFISLVIKNNIVSNFFSAIFAVMFYFISFFIDSGISRKNEIASRDSHIMALSSGISEFRRLKHDFFNILQTYGGYIEIGDILNLKEYHNSVLKISAIESTPLELSQLLPRNPPLISLLISKVEKASQMGVYLKVSITANFDDLYIDIVDLCRALACLLDNAIESACESEEKRVLFNLEKKGKYSKIIIITNSSPLPLNESILSKTGKSTKEGHSGLGVSTVRKTLEKYPNCRFHYGFFNCEVSAYIEIRP